MNELSPVASASHTTETAPASSAAASTPRHPVQPAAKPALGVLFLILGVIMPLGTLGYEWMTHACAAAFFDPIPNWWHVLLVAAVPVCNLLIWLKLRSRSLHPAAWLQHLAAGSIAVSGIYTLLFLPLAPLGAVFTLFYGYGLLPLTPLFAFGAAIRANSKLSATVRGGASPAPGFLFGLAALALPAGWDWATHGLLIRAASQPEPQSSTAVTWLRRIGHEEAMHAACYREPRWAWDLFSFHEARSVQPEQKQAVFYRVTGEPYNARPVPDFARQRVGGVPTWNFDAHLGGERVADKVAGLTLESSRLDGKVDAAALTSYTEWTFVFKNIAGNASEARAQIELPPGGAVSRLTLWIDGEPREAAFGGRSQVRAAYQEVAVVQRRDPVLVTTCGPDRILMQCFPVPANGGEMKVRVGITAPLRLLDARTAAADWPRMIETNFESSGKLRHAAWIEASAPFSDGKNTVRRDLDDNAFAAEPPLRLALSEAAGASLVSDPSDPNFLIRQTVETASVVRPRTVAWVIDGSRAMREHWRGIVASASQADRAPDAVFFAGDMLEEWTPNVGPLDRWLRARDCTGGRDNVPALNAAWDRVSAEAGGAILWIHGPQPVQLASVESLIQRLERGAHCPELFELTVASGPNRIAEKLDALANWRRARDGATPAERLTRLLDAWAGRTPTFIVKRERVPRTELSIPAANSDGHLARLWGREEIERLRATPARLDGAIKLALQLQLVTPVSGAVVLERKEQYDRHGLTPADPESVPMVPEPATTCLLAMGGAWLLARRSRRRAPID